jgi:hypothetical protein
MLRYCMECFLDMTESCNKTHEHVGCDHLYCRHLKMEAIDPSEILVTACKTTQKTKFQRHANLKSHTDERTVRHLF